MDEGVILTLSFSLCPVEELVDGDEFGVQLRQPPMGFEAHYGGSKLSFSNK